MLEDAPADPHGAPVFSKDHAELDGRAVSIPARVFGEAKKTPLRPPGDEA
jgi:hypothetical protein